jgi:hypothetical protein
MNRLRRKSTFIACGASLVGLMAFVAVSTTAGRAAPAVPDARPVAVQQWLGVASLPGTTWRTVQTPSGDRQQGYTPGVGVFQIDARTNEINEAIFDAQLRGGAVRHTQDEAQRVASAFAASHYAGFASLASDGAVLYNHGAFSEYRFAWQARSGAAWLPQRVTVSINPATGAVQSFWSERVLTLTGTTPQVTGQAALGSALALTHGAVSDGYQPRLEVELTPSGIQHLVWVTELSAQAPGAHGAVVPSTELVWTDAVTGTSKVVARS